MSGPTASTASTALPVGTYSLTVEAPQFATFAQEPIQVNVSQTVRVDVQLSRGDRHRDRHRRRRACSSWTRPATRSGAVVTGREIVDLPLNGRNFTQLGLLQTGVAPLTAGVATAGGSLRQGQAYAVNGMRPEQNVYLVDGAQNINRMDGGYALKLPVDAIAEFRILTQSAPPEFGGTGGATTSVVTRSGSNQFHGNLYEFVRNDAFDARNYFSEEVEPLKQNQFGGTIGRTAQEGPRVVLRLLRGLPQRAGDHDERDRADARAAAGRLLRPGRAADQFRGRRRADSRATRFRRRRSTRSRSTCSTCIRSATCRRRSTARRSWAGTTPTRPAAASTSTSRRPISSSGAIRTRAATTSTRSRCAAPTCPASRRATTWRRTRRRCRRTTSFRRR